MNRFDKLVTLCALVSSLFPFYGCKARVPSKIELLNGTAVEGYIKDVNTIYGNKTYIYSDELLQEKSYLTGRVKSISEVDNGIVIKMQPLDEKIPKRVLYVVSEYSYDIPAEVLMKCYDIPAEVLMKSLSTEDVISIPTLRYLGHDTDGYHSYKKYLILRQIDTGSISEIRME